MSDDRLRLRGDARVGSGAAPTVPGSDRRTAEVDTVARGDDIGEVLGRLAG